jgi:hypothetical protein
MREADRLALAIDVARRELLLRLHPERPRITLHAAVDGSAGTDHRTGDRTSTSHRALYVALSGASGTDPSLLLSSESACRGRGLSLLCTRGLRRSGRDLARRLLCEPAACTCLVLSGTLARTSRRCSFARRRTLGLALRSSYVARRALLCPGGLRCTLRDAAHRARDCVGADRAHADA